ncbi:MAG TPA: ComEC/Rec2 family competence protein [Anaerolineaceae bacterium]|nr:ComEC/Rec2 family competence protein [Anaerolineaceae bacterium]
MSGILLGIETDIPGDLKKAFQNTGTDHIIAISGFNMTILAGIFLKGFRKWLSIWWAVLLAILPICLYTIMVGGAPAVARAAVMSGLAMSANIIGRGQSGKYTLLLTASVMNLFNPLLLWNAGFQLSVMATLGLVLYADRLTIWFKNLVTRIYSEEKAEKISGPVSEYILFTMAAQLTTLPVVLYHFEKVSLTAILANPLILPVQPLVMIMGGISVMVGMIIAPLGQLLSYPVWILLFYTNQIVSWLAEFSKGIIVLGEMTWMGVLFLYGLIFFATHNGKQITTLNLKKPILLFVLLITSIFLVWNAVLLQPDQKLHVWVMDEGNQGVVIVQTPSGKKVLINAGESASQLSSELNKHIPTIHKTIDLAVVIGTNDKEYQGFSKILDRFTVDRFLWSEEVPSSAVMESIMNSTRLKKVEVGLIKDGDIINCGDGVSLEKWDKQKTGISFIMRYGQFRIVYLHDLSGVENQVLDGAVVFLKPKLDPTDFESNRTPQVIIHHVMVPGQDQPGQISTSHYGVIEIATDGEKMWLSGEK